MLSRRDDGYTLIELLVAVVIIGIIVVPLSEVLISYLRNFDTTAARLTESHDQQTAAAYWQQDVSSIGVRSSTYDPATHNFPLQQSVNGAFPCAMPAGSSTLVVLSWSQYDSSGTAVPVSVAYALDSTKTQLLRLHCVGSTVDSTATLAHSLNPAGVPAVTCAGPGGATCTGAGSAVPTSVTMTLSVKDTSGRGQPYTVQLNGLRRQT